MSVTRIGPGRPPRGVARRVSAVFALAVILCAVWATATSAAPDASGFPAGWTGFEDQPVALSGVQVHDPTPEAGDYTISFWPIDGGTVVLADPSVAGVFRYGSNELTGPIGALNVYLATQPPTYTPPPDRFGEMTVYSDIWSPSGVHTSASIPIEIAPVNDAPTLAPDDNVFRNGSFEDGRAGWTGNSGVEISEDWEGYDLLGPPPDGRFFVEIEAEQLADPSESSYIEQTVATVPGVEYVGAFSAVTRMASGTEQVALVVDGTVVRRHPLGDTWADYDIAFTATSWSTTIRLVAESRGGSLPGDSRGEIVDNVRLLPTSGPTLEFVEGGNPTRSRFGVRVHDGWGEFLAGATVAVLDPLAGDALSIDGLTGTSGTLASGITWSIAGDTLTFAGIATPADYQAAIDAVRFANTSDDPTQRGTRTSRTIRTVVVDDGGSRTDALDSTIRVVAVNDPPIGPEVRTYTTTSGDTLTVDDRASLLTDWSDPDSAHVRIVEVEVPGTGQTAAGGSRLTIDGYGELEVLGSGAFVFHPAPGFTGRVPDIVYTVTDDDGAEARGILRLVVIPRVPRVDLPDAPDPSEVIEDTTDDPDGVTGRVEPAAPLLAYTGSASARTASLGMLLTGAGLALVATARRRRTAA